MSLAPVLTYGSLNLTATPYLWEFGGDLGAPDNAAEVILSLLQDGDIEVSNRAGNRTISITILVEGANLGALADAEAALELECRKERNELTLDPGDGIAEPTVFDTFRGQLTLVRDDDFEQNTLRRYTLTMRAMPNGRRDTKTTALALPTNGTTTTSIDNGSATTGWTGSHTVTSSGGMVRSTTGSVAGIVTVSLTRTIAAVDLSAQTLVQVDWSSTWKVKDASLSLSVDGVAQEKIAETPLASGLIRSWFKSADTSVTVFLFSIETQSIGGAVVRELAIDQVSKTDVHPISGTGRQQMRSVPIGGSARTQADVAISHASSGLGHALFYSRKFDGSPYLPSLRPFRTSAGATTTDASTISGVYENDIGATSFTATVPKVGVPDGTYILIAALKGNSATATTLTVSTQTKVSTFGIRNTETFTAAVTLSTSWDVFQLGPRFTLPNTALSLDTNASVVVSISETAGGVTCQLDEAWLFEVGSGDLTWVNCFAAGFGGGYPAATRLWTYPPDVDHMLPRLLRGTLADFSDSFAAEPLALGAHEMEPGEMSLFTITTGATNPTVALEFYERFHTHAGPA